MTLAEERKEATPGDADSWFDEEDSSDYSDDNSDDQQSEKSESPNKNESFK